MNRRPIDLMEIKPLYYRSVEVILKDNYKVLTPEVYDHVLLFDTEVLYPSAMKNPSKSFRRVKIKDLSFNIYNTYIQFSNYVFEKWVKDERDFKREDYRQIYLTRGLCNLLTSFVCHFNKYECDDQTLIEITEERAKKLPQSVVEKALVKLSAKDLMPSNTFKEVESIWSQL